MTTAPARYRSLLAAYLSPQRARVALLAALLFGSTAFQLGGPRVLRQFIDQARAGSADELLVQTALLFLAVALAGQLFEAAVVYLGADVGWAATNALRADLLAHVLALDLRFHGHHTPGELIQRVDGDVAALSNFFSQFVVRVLGSLLLIAGIVALLLRDDWRLGLGMLALAALGAALLYRLQGVAVTLIQAHRQSFAELSGFWEERLLGTEDIRGIGALPYTMARQASLLGRHMRRARMGNTAGRIMQSAGELLVATGSAATFALSAYLLFGGNISLGTVYLVFAYTDLLAWNVLQIATQLDDFQQAAAGMRRIQELRAIVSSLPDTGRASLPAGPPALAFERVTFGYDQHEPVLRDVSFSLEAGATLGLLGRTGSGKSTIARLLFRFYDPQHGAIRLGGRDTRQLPLAALRSSIGLVTQDVQLFHASVRQNLALFDSAIADARMLEVLEELGLRGWLEGLPHGLDSPLTPGGVSAGQAQLLAFARVFLTDPALVVLDEASSRLDPATEQLIGQATERLLRGRTAILIAHRLATVARVDQIVILEGGRVAESGARAALQADPHSRFAQLLRTGMAEVLQ
jgi:ABC-type multidrug transport system fused ATPase/permease subunit